jgi:hypothetical protein
VIVSSAGLQNFGSPQARAIHIMIEENKVPPVNLTRYKISDFHESKRALFDGEASLGASHVYT